ncbi:16S rRNA m(7)G-527 methyltransferase [Alkalispirochaeta americana]|uniref:Ribosomal RNA small subunit methyltransferase G n=1 Tax=Alkalispirochaeta americana TaxID=159291 RepID=A0A1N6TGU7_9SPIO|nr:RsmG family class I SAM-dependent methyltransferase [Alkalispirochaeta americana]SIQ52618.1 16S rRNA m(7)G-527 methyltransferase [Alkalispirochaeta americana]
MMSPSEERLAQGLAAIPALPPQDDPGRSLVQLSRYLEDLYRSNPVFGLISQEDAADTLVLATRHLLDSAAGVPRVWRILERTGSRVVCDLGSGAGLPGIPLAILLEGYLDRCCLVERRERRVRFLQGALAPLGVSSLEVLQTDAERPCGEARALFQSDPPPVVVFRAYQQTTPGTLKGLAKVFPAGTTVVAWKGRLESAHQDARVIEAFPGTVLEEVLAVDVPFLERERSLLVFRIDPDSPGSAPTPGD